MLSQPERMKSLLASPNYFYLAVQGIGVYMIPKDENEHYKLSKDPLIKDSEFIVFNWPRIPVVRISDPEENKVENPHLPFHNLDVKLLGVQDSETSNENHQKRVDSSKESNTPVFKMTQASEIFDCESDEITIMRNTPIYNDLIKSKFYMLSCTVKINKEALKTMTEADLWQDTSKWIVEIKSWNLETYETNDLKHISTLSLTLEVHKDAFSNSESENELRIIQNKGKEIQAWMKLDQVHYAILGVNKTHIHLAFRDKLYMFDLKTGYMTLHSAQLKKNTVGFENNKFWQLVVNDDGVQLKSYHVKEVQHLKPIENIDQWVVKYFNQNITQSPKVDSLDDEQTSKLVSESIINGKTDVSK